jgi:ABC-type spermidine/putrescine transport system permease subunit I
MICVFLPFMALPIYTAVEKLDWSIVEAARISTPGAGASFATRSCRRRCRALRWG